MTSYFNLLLSLGACLFINLAGWLLEVPLLSFGQTMSLFIIFVLLFTFIDIAESLRKIADKKEVTFNYYAIQRAAKPESEET